MQFINDPRPWMDGRNPNLSMVDLVANETISVSPAAMLWWALERGASLLTAGGPSGAGKSTLAKACLSFLPNEARAYAVSGRDDPMLLPAGGGPTYLLINELSTHGRPAYISGPAARRAFARLRDGHRLVGTLHADSVDQAIEELVEDVGLSVEDIARVELIAITRVEDELARNNRHPFGGFSTDNTVVRRRIVEIGLLGPDPERGARNVELARLNEQSGRLEIPDPPAGIAALARWAGVPMPTAEAAIAERAEALARLAADGRRDPEDLEEAVRQLRTK